MDGCGSQTPRERCLSWSGRVLARTRQLPRFIPICRTRSEKARLAIVRELHREVVVLGLDEGDDLLQVVALLAGHPKLVALHLDLHALRTFVADQLGDLLGLLLADALLEPDIDLDVLAGLTWLADVEYLERLSALDDLLLQHLDDGERALVGVRCDLDRGLSVPAQAGAGVLEVVALRDLLHRLVEG